MDRRLLLLGVLVLLSSGAVDANWFTEQWNNLSSSVSGFWAQTSQLFTKAYTTMTKRFTNLSADVKGWLSNKSFKNATATKLLSDIPTDGWRELNPAMLMSASKSEVSNLISSGTGKVPQRFLDELNRLTLLNLTDEEVINTVQSSVSQCSTLISTAGAAPAGCQLTLSEVVTLVSRLGDPAKWSPQNVTDLGPVIFQLPVCLDKVQNDSTAQAVMDVLKTCLGQTPDSNCPSVAQLWTMMQMMVLRLTGPPATWSQGSVTAMGGVNMIPDYAVVYLNNSFITAAKMDIVKVPIPATKQQTCENWKAALCRAEQCTSMTGAADRTWYNSLGTLQVCMGPSDLSPAGLADATLKFITYNISNIRGKDINQQDASIILQDVLMNKTVDNITKPDVDALGGPLMMRAPACYLKAAAKRGLLPTVLPSMDTSVMKVQGPEFSAKINALLKANMATALVGGVFTLSKFIESLKPRIDPIYLKTLNNTVWKQVVDKAQMTRQPLSTLQIDTIMSQVAATDLPPYAPFFKEYASTKKIGSLSSNTLALLAKDMSPYSLPCLRGANVTFGGTGNLTVDMIKQGVNFLPCMSATDARRVAPSDLFKTFEAIKATGKPLSLAACRVFRDKLLDWAKTDLPTGLKSLTDIGQQLFLNDMATIPSCVIVDMGNIALQVMTREMKQVLLMQMCKMNILSTIPQDGRRLFINSIVGDMMSAAGAKLGICELNLLGMCAFDLSPDNMKKMDEFASSEFLKRLQKAFISPVPPCLDQSQQQQIGQMLISVKGPTNTWKDASDVSCIMGMLTSTNLMAIPDEVYTSTSCNIMMSPFEDGQPDVCKIAAMLQRKSIAVDQTKRCIKLRQAGTGATTCDKISCGGVAVMTSAEIRNLQLQDVKDNLEELGSQDMGMENAMVLADKVRQLRNQNNLTQEEQTKFGYIYQAFTKDDINNFTSWAPPAAKEMLAKMSDDAITALRDKILTKYKNTSNMTSQDLMLLGRVVCYLTQDQINAIPLTAFLDTMRYLGILDCSGQNSTVNLAARAVAAYSSDNRNIQYWDPATVSEMGLLMGGLSPESLAMMPDRAFSGLTSAGIQSIPPGVLKVIKVSQIKNLSPTTAASISASQMAQFNLEMKAALQGVLPSAGYRSGSPELCFSSLLGALVLVVVLVMM
ncbi:uncharacterized protein [Procambarus clarkii]|uniref:uncharacterized protein isoform X1 n=2 Tax=Procambarus clarkii TaxID=6728 RepID=UPI003743F894